MRMREKCLGLDSRPWFHGRAVEVEGAQAEVEAGVAESGMRRDVGLQPRGKYRKNTENFMKNTLKIMKISENFMKIYDNS